MTTLHGMKRVSLSELQKNTKEIIKDVTENNETTCVKVDGKFAIILSDEEYTMLCQLAQRGILTE